MRDTRTRIFRLRDGRTLEYAEYGDPRGTPMFFFHGMFGSCRQAALSDAAARNEKIRIIAPNRPGIGRSSPCRFTTMVDYAFDIEQLADHLRLRTFTCIGASGGGGFALATAYAFPERVKIAGVFGGIGPLNVVRNLQKFNWFRRMFLSGCHGYPTAAYCLLRGLFRFSRKYPRTFFRFLMSTSSAMAEEDIMARDDIRDALWRDYEAVFLQENGTAALLLETYLYFHWGFEPRHVPETVRVFFWHGRKDQIAPWEVIRDLSATMRGAQTIPCSGGHISFMVRTLDAVFLRLQKEWRLAPALA